MCCFCEIANRLGVVILDFEWSLALWVTQILTVVPTVAESFIGMVMIATYF